MADVSLVGDERHDEVIAFYENVNYGGTLATGDLVVGAHVAGRLVGVGRLVLEAERLVLRGMQVRKEFRRQGIGSSMLGKFQNLLGDRECWCVPYDHLRGFYSQAGFVKTKLDGAPGFLVERVREYADLGRQVILMKRPADTCADSVRE